VIVARKSRNGLNSRASSKQTENGIRERSEKSDMNTKYSFKITVPAVLLGLVLSVPAFAQDESTHDAMHSAGANIKQAGSDTAAAAEDVYTGTKRAVKDTAITAKIKTALHDDAALNGSDIHVSTKTGVVTLQGQVSSREAAARAEDLAAHTNGVKRVNNQLMVVNANASSRTD